MMSSSSLLEALNLSYSKLFLVSILLILIGIFYYKNNVQYMKDVAFGERQGCKPPTARLHSRWPLAIDLVRRGFQAGRQKKLLALFNDYFEELGPTAQLDVLGGTGFATKDPENIEALLSGQFEDFHLGPRSKAMRALVGDGIFTQDGPSWKHSRELLRRQFVRMQYQNLEGFREHIESLISRLRGESANAVDLQPLLYRLTLNTTIAMILGQPVESFEHEIGDQFSKAFNKASLITATRVRLGDLYFMYTPRGFFKACQTVKSYTYDFVRDALVHEKPITSEKDKSLFINDLYQENRDLNPVRDQVINVLIAGRDTTAATISYAIRLMLQHPQSFAKVRKEISEVVGDEKTITRSHIQRARYLQNALKETLRLYPPVPINSRFCKNTTTLPVGGGADGRSPILIRAGMPVAYSVYHMHRREDLYGKDACQYRPERWEDVSLNEIGWGYLPFNGGPRVCLGSEYDP